MIRLTANWPKPNWPRVEPVKIAALYRYPVKGLSPEPVSQALLQACAYWPGDRMFAIENGPSGFDPAEPVHHPKIKFLMLMRNEALARLVTRFDDQSQIIAISHEGREVARGDVGTAEGRAAIEGFLAAYSAADLRGPPRLLTAPVGFRFTDSRSGHVSMINLASVADLENRMGEPLDPLRFRGNIYVEGLPALAELDWPAGTLITTASGAVLEMVKRTERCAATNVDPVTGLRDRQVPRALMKAYGHVDCGVYLRIVAGGALTAGLHLDISHLVEREHLPMG
jgi:uncharacterized protein